MSSSGLGEEELRAEIWSGTPEDVQLGLLQLLPLTSLARFRCVSKRWRSAIATTTPSMSSKKPCLVTSQFQGVCVSLSDDVLAWRHFGAPQDSSEVFFEWRSLDLPQGRAVTVSNSAGLLLATHGLNKAEGLLLSVHNPLVQGAGGSLGHLSDVRGLPSGRPQLVVFAGIEALQSTRTIDGGISFAVVCITSDLLAVPLMHVFDSRSRSWVVECAGLMNDSLEGQGGEAVYQDWMSHTCFLLQDQRLLFLTVSRSDTRSLRSVSIWDPEHTLKTLATWTNLPLDLRQNPYELYDADNNFSLICCQGKLMLVGYAPCPPPLGSIGFVYLDEGRRCWRELKSFPLEDLPEEAQQNIDDRAAAWGGGPDSSTVTLCFIRTKWGCLLDLADSTWCSLSPFCTREIRPFHPSFLTPL